MQAQEPPLKDKARCPICRAQLNAALPFCPVCGAQLDDALARDEEELRSILFLLSELERWERSGRLSAEQSGPLRFDYERRRDELRREIAARRDEKFQPRAKEEPRHEEPQRVNIPPPAPPTAWQREHETQAHQRESEFVAFPARPAAHTTEAFQQPVARPRDERTLLERLADPQTLRLLLYTGAGMLVVGVVIWLRDLLYLKLQEPTVQAALLALGTLALIGAGWYTILRTRQRWTGRAVTLAGSLLIPVNFWFLVRSGLIENHGRGWVVGIFCAIVYANTAAFLRERLYVYLACAASVATLWALILRDAPRAFGLYALALMTASLTFIHLSQLLPAKKESEVDEEQESVRNGLRAERWSREFWGAPLARTSLVFALLGALIYMALRFSAQAPSFYNGIFRLRSSEYDASIAILILIALAYVFWFAGRFVYAKLSAVAYTTSALVFFSAAWATCDGLRLSGSATVLLLALLTFIAALAARNATSQSLTIPLHRASLVVSILLGVASISVALASSGLTWTHSASLALVALAFAALCDGRLAPGAGQTLLAYLAALYFSASYFVLVASASLHSQTLNTLLCALWPLILFGAAELTAKAERETHLYGPFKRVADGVALLLLLWGSVLTLLIYLDEEVASHASSLISLAGVVVYCALRTLRSRTVYGASYGALLGSLSAVVLAAGVLDLMQRRHVWPSIWPVAAGVIVFAFILERGCARLSRSVDEALREKRQALIRSVRLVLDSCVGVCALIWLVTAFTLIGAGGFGATSVLLLALLYRVERAAQGRNAWLARITCAHMAAFLIAFHIALRADAEWLVLLSTVTLFPIFFILSRNVRSAEWLRAPLSEASVATLALSLICALLQASPHLQAGDPHLLSPSLTVALVALLSFIASIFSRARASVIYFRTGLWVSVLALMLASLRSGFDPVEDLEVYTTPVAVLLLIIAYLSLRRAWQEYDKDVGLLLWIGSLLLCLPLLGRALEFRVLLGSAAPWRDVSVLGAALALVLYGVVGRMRAPVLVGAATLITELVILTLTTVDWLQVPLKYYLITVGALLLIVFGTLEYRREQFLAVRQRFQERRDRMREQFGEWR